MKPILLACLFALNCYSCTSSDSTLGAKKTDGLAVGYDVRTKMTFSRTVNDWQFTSSASEFGLTFQHKATVTGPWPGDINISIFSGGLAAADLDEDGYAEILLLGDENSNALFKNESGGFVDVTAASGLAETGEFLSALFADVTGDSKLDVILAGYNNQSSLLFTGDGFTFDDTTTDWLFTDTHDAFSIAATDFDRDGDLDFALARWYHAVPPDDLVYFYSNEGDYVQAANQTVGLTNDTLENTFSPIFADVNFDGHADLLYVGDFESSVVFNGDGQTFDKTSGPEITDTDGMGAAIGDYDNDGDLDWFVSSIWDEDGVPVPPGGWGVTGNRLYQNNGNGYFTDVSAAAGVREGYWGWGSCMADFNNDGWLDIFHTNGMGRSHMAMFTEFLDDPAVLFVSNGDGTFSERAVELGIADNGNGRGVACFDLERDGDVDILVQNNDESLSVWQNQAPAGSALIVRLRQETVAGQNRPGGFRAIGAQIRVYSAGYQQVGAIIAGNHFLSQNPAEIFFGLGNLQVVNLEIRWPDAVVTRHKNVATDQMIEIVRTAKAL